MRTATKVFIFLALSSCAMAQTGNKQIRLFWDKNSESDMSHYTIYFGRSSGIYDASPIQVNHPTTEFIFTNLHINHPDTTIYFVVTATDQSGNESGYSDEVMIHTGDLTRDTTAPLPPAALRTQIIEIITTQETKVKIQQ